MRDRAPNLAAACAEHEHRAADPRSGELAQRVEQNGRAGKLHEHLRRLRRVKRAWTAGDRDKRCVNGQWWRRSCSSGLEGDLLTLMSKCCMCMQRTCASKSTFKFFRRAANQGRQTGQVDRDDFGWNRTMPLIGPATCSEYPQAATLKRLQLSSAAVVTASEPISTFYMAQPCSTVSAVAVATARHVAVYAALLRSGAMRGGGGVGGAVLFC
eukprot:6209209-Pleurochrysis_carterae.AAC.3